MPADYVKQTWVNGVAGGTPITAARLSYMEDGIDNATVPDGTYVQFAPPPTGTTADATAVQALLDTLPSTGGFVMLRETTSGGLSYNFGTVGVHCAPQKRLLGSGMRATRIDYAGTGFAITAGNATLGTAVAYGNGVADLRIVCANAASGGIELRETAAAAVADVYIEGPANQTSTGIGVFVNAGDTGSIFTKLDNVVVNHFKYPHRWGTTGSIPTTSVTAINCTGFADLIAGSAGLTVDASGSGAGSRWVGGNLENCVNGVSLSGIGVSFFGLRTENNTTDVRLNAGTVGNVFSGCIDMLTVVDNSGNKSNQFIANVTASAPGTVRPSVLGPLQVSELAHADFGVLGAPGGGLSVLHDSGPFGLFAGVSNSGHSWLQATRNDGTGTAYDIIVQQGGGNIGVGDAPAEKHHVYGNSKVSGKVLAVSGLGVGNSVAATIPGTVTKKMEVFDSAGTSLGFVAIYDAIA